MAAAPILFVNDGTPYIPYNPVEPTTEQSQLLEFLKQIFPVDEDREDALKMFAACLQDRCERDDERMIFLQGAPASGKSVFAELLQATFGDAGTLYLGALNNLSRYILPDSITWAELALKEKDKKLIILQYDDRYRKLISSSIKILTTTDLLFCNPPSEGRTSLQFKPQTMMICHEVPEFTSMDDGLRRRIKVIPFKSKFIKRQKAEGGQGKSPFMAELTEAFGPYKGDEIKWPAAIHYQDHEIRNKLRGWAPHFAGILVWYFPLIIIP